MNGQGRREAGRHRRSELAAMRAGLAAMRLELAFLRLFRLAVKAGYDPAQPRLPRGRADGGLWTGGGAGGLPAAVPGRRAGGGRRYAQANGGRAASPRLVRTPRGAMSANLRQELEFELATLRANEALALVRRVDPGWKPRPGFYETIDGAIVHQRSIPGQAEARLRSLARPLPGRGDNGGPPLNDPPQPAPTSNLLLSHGQPLGFRAGRARAGIYTLPEAEFDELALRLTRGVTFRAPGNSYSGYHFELADRCVLGIRISKYYGLTIDVVDVGLGQGVLDRFKFHRSGLK